MPGKAEGPERLIHNGKDLCSLEALEGEGSGVGASAQVANTDDRRPRPGARARPA